VQVIEAHFAPCGLEPLQDDGKPSLAGLIQKHAMKLSTAELVAVIQKHHPAVTVAAIHVELMRQADANAAEADALIAAMTNEPPIGGS
jgi:hypothetical protein